MQYQNNREIIVVQQVLITTSPHNLLTAQVHTLMIITIINVIPTVQQLAIGNINNNNNTNNDNDTFNHGIH